MELVIALFLIPPLIIPAIIGLYMISRPARLRKLIGWFTFKPVLATPLFLVLYLAIGYRDTLTRLSSLFPGLILTLLLLWVYRDFFRGQTSRIAFSLLILDVLRWGSALVSVIFVEYTFCFGPNCPRSSWGPLLFLFTMAFPTLYAIAALVLNRVAKRETPVTNTGEVPNPLS